MAFDLRENWQETTLFYPESSRFPVASYWVRDAEAQIPNPRGPGVREKPVGTLQGSKLPELAMFIEKRVFESSPLWPIASPSRQSQRSHTLWSEGTERRGWCLGTFPWNGGEQTRTAAEPACSTNLETARLICGEVGSPNHFSEETI